MISEDYVGEKIKCIWEIPKPEVFISDEDKRTNSLFSVYFPAYPVFSIELEDKVFSINFTGEEESLLDLVTSKKNILKGLSEDVLKSIEVEACFSKALEDLECEIIQTISEWLGNNGLRVWTTDENMFFIDFNSVVIIGKEMIGNLDNLFEFSSDEEAANFLYDLDENHPVTYLF